MKKIKLLSLIAIFITTNQPTLPFFETSSAITYKLNGGRLGDNLINYCKAKWIEFTQGFEFYYTKFPQSNLLMIEKYEKLFDSFLPHKFKRVIPIHKTSDFAIQGNTSTLYISDYYFTDSNWANWNSKSVTWTWKEWSHISNMIDTFKQSQSFIDGLKKTIQPQKPIQPPSLPINKITVAVHIRKRGHDDPPLLSNQYYSKKEASQYNISYPSGKYSDVIWPPKFPPNQFYIDQIKWLSTIFNHTPLYVYIFTDAKNPEQLTKEIKNAVNISTIEFDCRQNNTLHPIGAIDDLFAMTIFDCFIRSHSSFAVIAEVIGEHKLTISPQKWSWKANNLIIDEVNLRLYPSS